MQCQAINLINRFLLNRVVVPAILVLMVQLVYQVMRAMNIIAHALQDTVDKVVK